VGELKWIFPVYLYLAMMEQNFWILIQVDYTICFWSYFIKKKSELLETVADWLWLVKKVMSHDAKCTRLDNSGESKTFHELFQFKTVKN
jgi:hypothetical protein